MADANFTGALFTNHWVSWSRQYRRGWALTPPDHFSATVPPLSSYGGSTPMRRWSESGLPSLVNVRSGYSTGSRVKNQPCILSLALSNMIRALSLSLSLSLSLAQSLVRSLAASSSLRCQGSKQ